LELAETLGAVFEEIALAGLGARPQPHEGGDIFPKVWVSDADRRGLDDIGVTDQRLVHFSRRDVGSGLDDQLLDATGVEEVAVLVAIPEVTGTQPPGSVECGR